ncbi:hypothetical protein KY290_013609 [Solanum tuberosum]|uniref:Uncharacterized protein n=1 Tax=Solanum tuberosum TaxID=4113 RepID=A0ABQ7VMF8_SOLTU|nr:hypothetical protein KY289_013736 [Solanum tuberosum]KAH0769628.1 hypothetical protein KY290_013609 [Solanum tuberosum]
MELLPKTLCTVHYQPITPPSLAPTTSTSSHPTHIEEMITDSSIPGESVIPSHQPTPSLHVDAPSNTKKHNYIQLDHLPDIKTTKTNLFGEKKTTFSPSCPLKDLDNLPYIETPFTDKIQNLNIPSTTLRNKHGKTFNIPNSALTTDLSPSSHYASSSTLIPTKEIPIKHEHPSIQSSTHSYPKPSDPNEPPIPLSKSFSSRPSLPSNGRREHFLRHSSPPQNVLAHSWVEMGMQDHALSFSVTVDEREVVIVVRNPHS